jgi:hypothetical protein
MVNGRGMSYSLKITAFYLILNEIRANFAEKINDITSFT